MDNSSEVYVSETNKLTSSHGGPVARLLELCWQEGHPQVGPRQGDFAVTLIVLVDVQGQPPREQRRPSRAAILENCTNTALKLPWRRLGTYRSGDSA